MAGNTSRPGATVVSRVLALLGAFDETHRRLTLTELADGPTFRSRPRTAWSASSPPTVRSRAHRRGSTSSAGSSGRWACSRRFRRGSSK